ncbi:hypothetical protein HKX48_004816 [Thoreauomyces humboldtii]|nr:hypothetical protein HKX48_004816 [Thoreauomyces humboldtii]
MDSEITAVAWKLDGRLVAVGCMDGRVRIVDVETAEVLQVEGTGARVDCIEWVEWKDAQGDVQAQKVD